NLARVRSDGRIANSVASSGIAALLLTGGQTVHSRFKLPLGLTEVSICSISKQSNLADLYRETSLIIWDEAAMAHRFALEAVDRPLRNITAILTPISADVNVIYDLVMHKLPSAPSHGRGVVMKTYQSIDAVETQKGQDGALHQQEILNSINLPGIPPHKLTLKEGAPIMLIRNLNAAQGLCNGTGLQVYRLSNKCIHATILTGTEKGNRVSIPRVTLISDGKCCPSSCVDDNSQFRLPSL
ncbi:TPA: hypothetical protein N0F65_001491, partial [Lagenidium giganteum]